MSAPYLQLSVVAQLEVELLIIGLFPDQPT